MPRDGSFSQALSHGTNGKSHHSKREKPKETRVKSQIRQELRKNHHSKDNNIIREKPRN